jgi:uncharacterized peroxidase-related enzyme
MPFISTPTEPEATGAAVDVFVKERQQWGFVPNYAALFALRPDAHEAWGALVTAARRNMDRRLYELVTIAAARALQSTYCSLAHTQFLITKANDPAGAEAAATGAYEAIGRREAALMRYAEQIVRDAASITESDIEALRRAGASEEDILNTALAASVRCFFAKFLDAVGVQPDRQLADALGPELAEPLIVGRVPA